MRRLVSVALILTSRWTAVGCYAALCSPDLPPVRPFGPCTSGGLARFTGALSPALREALVAQHHLAAAAVEFEQLRRLDQVDQLAVAVVARVERGLVADLLADRAERRPAVLAGRRFGNAQSEAGTKHVQDIRTRLQPQPDGSYVLTGVKHYSTGALFADWIPVLARAEGDKLHVAYVPADAPGLSVIDDWDGLGQRTTASGTVRLVGVPVPGDRVLPHHLTFEGPQLHGAVAQLLHAAIDAGIAAGALAEAAEFVRTKSRPWFESGVETAAEDPLLIQRFGELALQTRASEALLREAARAVDAARNDLTDDTAAEASVAVAAAKVQAAQAAVEVASALFEVSGTRAALNSLNLHRHWRDARTHTLHDPARWKIQHIGRYVLNGTRPPRHGLL